MIPDFGLRKASYSDTDRVNTIKSVCSGKRYLASTQMEDLSRLMSEDGNNPFDRLSPREMEVALLLLKGEGLREIAEALHLSPSTASTVKTRVFDKL